MYKFLFGILNNLCFAFGNPDTKKFLRHMACIWLVAFGCLFYASAQAQTVLTTPVTIDFNSASQGAFGGGSSYDYAGITFSVNGSGGIDTFNPVANFLGITLSNFSGNGIIGDYTWTGTTANHVTAFTMQANSHTKFKLTSLDIAAGNGGPAQIFTITGYVGGAGGTPVAQITGFDITLLTSATHGSGANQATSTLIGPSDGSGYGRHIAFTGSNWQNIDAVVFSAASQNDITLGFDNIVLDNPVLAVPGAPTSPSATAGNTQATVTFTAPASNGGAAITTYTATANPGGATGTCAGPTACSINVTGLTNGTAYTFTVTATNSVGTGSASTATSSVTPKAAQTITFANPGAQNFGTSPTLSATSDSSLSPTFTSSTTGVCTITSGGVLTFVTVGTCTINANQAGNGSFLAATQVSRSFTVNAVVPSAPTIGTATAGNTQASVTFTAPTTNGGATITGYTVTASPGGATGTGVSSPITVTGLTNGVAYTFTVTATNSVGTGSASAASNSITAAAMQTITFTNPGAQNFGTTPTLTATADSSLPVSFTSSTTGVCTITTGGVLTFVAAGTCTINADQAGNSSFLAANQVSRSFTVNAAVPGAPTVGAATAGNTQASVTFTAPASNGGASITGYTVTSNPGGITGTGSTSPIIVTGLTNGTAYTFTVTATNSSGTGSASAASNSITPKAAQTITFTNPGAQNFGTTPTLTATSDSSLTTTFTSSTTGVCTVTSGGTLTFVTAGTCTINADQAGNGSFLAASQVSRSFTVNAVIPGAPTIGAATAGNTQASVAFTAPASSGGASITGYTVTSSPGGITATGSASPITVTGLTNGTAYTFTVTATNSSGTGSASAASNSITPKAVQTITFANPGAQNFGTSPTLTATSDSSLPPTFTSSTTGVCTITSGGVLTFVTAGTCTINADQAGNGSFLAASQVSRSFTVNAVVPGTPIIGSATAGNAQASVSFTAPAATGAATITGYTVTANPGGATGTGSISPITVTGLTNGTAYTFTVTATNSAGTGSASAASNSVTPKASQTITFANPGAQSFATAPTLTATSSSSLVPTFTSSTTGVCTITSGGILTFVATGTCTINVNQAGNSSFLAASQVSRSFMVNAATNSAPVISQGSSTSVTMSEDGAPAAFSLTLTATDVNNDPLTWSIASQPAHGSASVSGNGSVGYIPAANFNGSDSFIVSVSDGQVSTSIHVNVTVTPVNDAPVINGSPVTHLNQDTAYSFTPMASDVDGDTLTFSIVNKPAWASFNTATGVLSGTPAKANVGITSGIIISVSDGTLSTALPAFAIEVASTVDPALPVLKAPDNLVLNATALYTSVSLRQLLGLVESASQADVTSALDTLAVDSAGNSCCAVTVDGVTADKGLLLQPGHYALTWTAKNQAGLTTSATQTLDVRPLVSLSKSQIALRGTHTEFRVILNGLSPVYPFTVSYVVDGSTTAATSEYTLANGSVTFTQGQLEVPVAVELTPVSGAADSQIVVRLTGDINPGANNSHTINIRSGNVPPMVSLSLTQGGFPTTTVTPGGGPVTVTANVTDPNVNDTHTFDWSGTSGLPDTDGNLANATRVFEPTGLSGSYRVQVDVADSAGAKVQAQLYFRVIPTLPVLSATDDTDGDGIADALEGTGDSDGNGIPDYLDNMRSSNILPQKIINTDKYLIECDPGVRCGLGLLAMAGSTGGVQILDSEVATIANLKADTAFTPIGGIFDFAVSDLSTPGQSVNIVIPQTAPIPANAVYRKFQKGQWVNFVENADNVLRSTAGLAGYCPPPGSADWKPGLIAGNFCVQLTISDGGPNDADGIVNSAVVDPGAVSVAVVVPPPVTPPTVPEVEIKTKGSGGAIDFTFLLILTGGLLLIHGRSKHFMVGALLLIALNSQAADFSGSTYLRLDAYSAKGSQDQNEFNSRLIGEGYDFSLHRYDVDRTGFQISFGYKWNEKLYTELGYLDLGSVRVNLALDGNEDQTAFGKAFSQHYPTSGNGLTLVQGFRIPLEKNWSLSPEVGAFVWKEKVDVNGAHFKVNDKSGTDLLLGLHLDYQLTNSFSAGIEFRSILFSDDHVNLWGISTRWDF